MLDVLLVNPYVLSRHEPRRASYRPYPPLGLMYLGAVLREAGFTVEIFDATFLDSPDEIQARLDNGPRPRVVGVFAMNSFRDDALAMIKRFKTAELTVWAGGPDPSIYDGEYINAGTDVVIRGEGEVAILELMSAFGLVPGEDKAPVLPPQEALLKIHGLTSKDSLGEQVKAKDRAASKTMDELPRPAYDLIDLHRYVREWKQVHGYASIQFMTSRGCPFSCAWCARPIFGRKYRQFSARRAAEEVKFLVDTYGIGHLWLFDDTFVVRRQFVEAFCDAIVELKVKVRWECLARVDLTDRGLLERMKAAGVDRINFGFESGSQRILDRMQKGTTVVDARRVAKDMHELGISMGGYVLMGYPGEEWPDIQKTIDLLKDIQPVDYSTSVAMPMPGTNFHDLVRDMMHKDNKWAETDPDAVIWDAPYGRGFYRLVESLMHAEYDLGLEFTVRRKAKAVLLRSILSGMHAVQKEERLQKYRSDRFKGWQGLRKPSHSARHRATHAKKAAEARGTAPTTKPGLKVLP